MMTSPLKNAKFWKRVSVNTTKDPANSARSLTEIDLLSSDSVSVLFAINSREITAPVAERDPVNTPEFPARTVPFTAKSPPNNISEETFNSFPTWSSDPTISACDMEAQVPAITR
jgi:hypothetical protein